MRSPGFSVGGSLSTIVCFAMGGGSLRKPAAWSCARIKSFTLRRNSSWPRQAWSRNWSRSGPSASSSASLKIVRRESFFSSISLCVPSLEQCANQPQKGPCFHASTSRSDPLPIQFVEKPRARERPLTFGRALRNPKALSRFLVAQAEKETQFHQFRGGRFLPPKQFEGFVNHHQGGVVGFTGEIQPIQIQVHTLSSRTSFERVFAAGILDQNPSHCFGGRPEEMAPA